MQYSKAIKKLESIEQQHLLSYWNRLSKEEQVHLLNQIDQLDLEIFQQQRKLLHAPAINEETFTPFSDYANVEKTEANKAGWPLIAKGQMGCLLIAGGQGTRLRFHGPKGCFPLSIVNHKSLFQLFAEKVRAASDRVKRPLPLAIMTSPLNHEATLHFFKEHSFFGLHPDQISFFSQGMLPFLDQQGNLFLEDPHTIAVGPNGNGLSLHHFVEQGIWEKWHKQGVRYLNYVLVDNPLADPFDAALLGYHARQNLDITVKCIMRHHPQEKVGLLVKKEGKISVVEYSELPAAEGTATNSDGTLKHHCANISLFCFDMNFIKLASKKHAEMPLHPALKKAKSLLAKDHFAMAWKFEAFIFDLLAFAARVNALLYPRERCFAPLKNFEGDDSPATVQQALLQEDRRRYQEATGLPPPEQPFELPPELYYSKLNGPNGPKWT